MKRRIITIIVIIALLAAAAVGVYFVGEYLEERKIQSYSDNISAVLTLEAGQSALNAEDFLIDSNAEMTVTFADASAVDLNVPGSYDITVECDGYAFARVVEVVDTTPPTGETQDVTFFLEPELKAEDFVTNVQDISDVEITFGSEPDLTVAGDQAVILILTDAAGNTTELHAKLTVILDTEAPVISGVSDIELYAGDTVSYRSGIEVTDDMDEAPKLEIDSSAVDLSTPGTYTVVYTATDASGNVTTEEAVITVKEKKAGYVDVETIYAAADELLTSIVNDSMSKREQVEAIYKWMRSHLGYSGHSDKSDWLQGAYTAMTKRTGDCFSYFALSKLFLERLGIDNINVVKVKNYEGDSSHYWSLVSLDGGATWYHFDTTPRVGSGDNFCLVTDAFLDAYSAANNNCFNRDKSLYPATPEE